MQLNQTLKKKGVDITAVWQDGGFSAKLNIRVSNKHWHQIESKPL